jgi:hypothetical protein
MDFDAFTVALQTILARVPISEQFKVATQIQSLFSDLPSYLTTVLWVPPHSADSLLNAFGRKSYRQIDRQLMARERSVRSLPSDSEERQRVAWYRNKMLCEMIADMAQESLASPSRTPPMRRPTQFVHPTLFRFSPRETGEDGPVYRLLLHLKLYQRSKRRWIVTDERIVQSQRRRIGEQVVDWLDPEEVNREVIQFLKRHLLWPRCLQRYPGTSLRSRRTPGGWPLITQIAVPALLHVLDPYYVARRYRDHLPLSTVGISLALAQDIADLLASRFPHIAGGLTRARVYAVLKRHLDETCSICTELARTTS